MKRIAGFFTSLVLLLGTAAPAVAAQPLVKARIHGFSVTEMGSIDIISADTFLYTHEKTGAQVFHIANDDINRAMIVSFETPALDNKGIPHVFEHICASGSESYPSPNLFLSALSQTYNTHMNATTYNSMTNYQYATMSEAQLLLMADFYLDAVFNPLLYVDDLTFQREAWHYELEDEDAQLTVNGVVYNEMKGAISLTRAASHNLLNTLYPGSVAANNSGGIPEDIYTLTLEETLDFHQTYYHPSNALIFIYGDVDIGQFLELVDSYCSDFERQEIYVEKGKVEPFEEPVTAVFEFPMEQSAAIENQAVIYYAMALGELSPEEFGSFDILTEILNKQSSPIKQAMREALPNANISVSFNPSTAGCFLAVSSAGLNESDMDVFKETVDNALISILEDGFDLTLLEATIAAEEFYILSFPENSGLGMSIITTLAWLGSTGAGYEYFNDYLAALDTAKKEYKNGYFEDIIAEYLISNPHSALVATLPAPGMAEQLSAEFAAELAEIKANMTPEEIQTVIETGERLAEMAAAELPAGLMERLTAVTVDTLPEEVKTYSVSESEINGVDALITEANVGGINITCVDYNASAITVEELHYFNLYAYLIGKLPTENYDLPSLQTNMTRYLNSFTVSAGSREFYDFSYQPIFAVQWMSLNDDYKEATELIQELILATDLTSTELINGYIGQLKSGQRNSINSRPDSIMYNRALANRFERSAYNDYMRNVPYYQFLLGAQELLANDPEAFIAKLENVRAKLIYNEDVSVMFAGNADGIELFEENAGILFDHLTDEPLPYADLSDLPSPSGSEALVVDSSVQFNVMFSTYEDIGLEYNGKLLPLAAALEDSYITPEVRYTLGAYGAWSVFSRYGFALLSYRDPGIAQTFEAYAKIHEFAKNNELTQDDLDRYIISVFSSNTVPVGELSGALSYMLNYRLGYPEDYVLNVLREIKSATIQDLKDIAENLEKFPETAVRSSSGSEAAITENSGLFDDILYAFVLPSQEGAETSSGEVSGDFTRIELLTFLFGEDVDLYQLAVDEGLIPEDVGGDANSVVTREEFAYVFVMALEFQPEDFPLEDEYFEIADNDDISDWAYECVQAAITYGFLTLDEDGGFNPQAPLTYASVEAALVALFGQ